MDKKMKMIETDTLVSKILRLVDASLLELREYNRKIAIREKRHIAFFLIRRYTDHSLTIIGKFLHRDHATVINSCRKVNDYASYDKNFRKYLNGIKEKLENEI